MQMFISLHPVQLILGLFEEFVNFLCEYILPIKKKQLGFQSWMYKEVYYKIAQFFSVY